MDKIHSKDCVIRLCRHCAVPMSLKEYHFNQTCKTWLLSCKDCNIYTEIKEDMHKSKRDDWYIIDGDDWYIIDGDRYNHDQFSKREVDTILMNGLNIEE